ncbi:hypothetical protein J2X72_001105 [Phyllobacterium sp. 1468]|nr:hypothetical protein [Phyllobacterium sp. 1468]
MKYGTPYGVEVERITRAAAAMTDPETQRAFVEQELKAPDQFLVPEP